MFDYLIKILLIILISANSYALDKPIKGHLFHMKQVNNYARQIEKSDDLKIIAPDFVDILKRQKLIIGKGKKSLEILKQVNNEINSKGSFALSPWMTPNEFKIAKYADCKAYATTKYYKLRELGWSEDELNLWSGDYDGTSHLILTARIDDKVYVLDIMDQNLPEAKDYFYNHFIPSYRFNEKGVDTQ